MKQLTFIFVLVVLGLVSCANAQSKKETDNFRLAAEYSKQMRGLSVLVIKGDKIVFEEYQNGHDAATSHFLASGTKSFSGVMAVAAAEDGLLKLDERVSDTITEWKTDPQRSKITIRQLLTLTSGIDTGQNFRPPSYAEAVGFSAKYPTGEMFEYGPVPFQTFGELLRRKLAARKETRNETPLDYLKRRILDPIGAKIGDWRMIDGQADLPGGASMTARDWAKFGQFLKNGGKWNGKQIVSKKLLDECFQGTKTNPNYGLTFWLNRSSDGSAKVAEKRGGRFERVRERLGIEAETTEVSKKGFGANLPKDIYVAAGAGKQRLYVIPSLDVVVVRQGRQSRFDDEKFLSRLLFGKQ